MPLDRRAERLLAMVAATAPADGAGGSALARREALASLAEMADDRSTGVAFARDYEIAGPGGPLALRLYAPQVAEPEAPAMVFLHGGGWVAGDLATHDGLCRRICAASGFKVIAVDYRLAPEHPFPAALTDALAALRWVAANARKLGIDAARLAIGGDSVGGGLAATVAQLVRRGGPRLALQVLICPILDVTRLNGSRAEFANGFFISRDAFAADLANYLPAALHADDPHISPGLARDLTQLPPALIHTAEFDPFRDEGEAFGWALEGAGVEAHTVRHPGMIHYFYAVARAIPYGQYAAALMGAQMRERMAPAIAANAVSEVA